MRTKDKSDGHDSLEAIKASEGFDEAVLESESQPDCSLRHWANCQCLSHPFYAIYGLQGFAILSRVIWTFPPLLRTFFRRSYSVLVIYYSSSRIYR